MNWAYGRSVFFLYIWPDYRHLPKLNLRINSIWVKRQETRFWWKFDFFVKNQNLGQKTKHLSKIEILWQETRFLTKILIFDKKFEFSPKKRVRFLLLLDNLWIVNKNTKVATRWRLTQIEFVNSILINWEGTGVIG